MTTITLKPNVRTDEAKGFIEDINGNRLYVDCLIAAKSRIWSHSWPTPTHREVSNIVDGKEIFHEDSGIFYSSL